VLSELRRRRPNTPVYLDWSEFMRAGAGVFLWGAFVTDRAKAATHVDDAAVAVAAFRDALPDPASANAVEGERPLSLLGAALVWSGWTNDPQLLRAACLVVRASPRAATTARDASGGAASPSADPLVAPGAVSAERRVERPVCLVPSDGETLDEFWRLRISSSQLKSPGGFFFDHCQRAWSRARARPGQASLASRI
jgi:hypothetical protein